MNFSRIKPGALALVGSGEYLPQMEATDRFLLDTLGGPAAARVVVIPTASALEPGMPERWNTMGLAHFRTLGAVVTPALLLTRDDAHDEQVLAELAARHVLFFGRQPASMPSRRCATRRRGRSSAMATWPARCWPDAAPGR